MENLVIDNAQWPGPLALRHGAATPVLVTGADGYIGSVLVPYLSELGYDVVGLDSGFYRSGWLYNDGHDRPTMLNRDFRTLRPADLCAYEAVVHLAELSNDPLCELDPETSFAINHRGTVALAKACKEAGVARFVYTSSCSVYGAGGNSRKTEDSPVDPITAYAMCKVLVERDVSALADSSFCPTFLRNATAFGASPRMRFDIAVNNLAGIAWTTRRIVSNSDGMAWRPMVHVEDIAEAVALTLEAPAEAVHNQVFNVGDDRNNHRVCEIVEIIADVFPDCEVSYQADCHDARSYQVSFAKIHERLPDFECRWDVERGARQLRNLFDRIGLTAETFEAAPFTRLRQLRRLIETGQLREDLQWQAVDLLAGRAARASGSGRAAQVVGEA